MVTPSMFLSLLTEIHQYDCGFEPVFHVMWCNYCTGELWAFCWHTVGGEPFLQQPEILLQLNCASSTRGCCETIVRSSAYVSILTAGLVGTGKSCLKRLKRDGERPAPCGSLFGRCLCLDITPTIKVEALSFSYKVGNSSLIVGL